MAGGETDIVENNPKAARNDDAQGAIVVADAFSSPPGSGTNDRLTGTQAQNSSSSEIKVAESIRSITLPLDKDGAAIRLGDEAQGVMKQDATLKNKGKLDPKELEPKPADDLRIGFREGYYDFVKRVRTDLKGDHTKITEEVKRLQAANLDKDTGKPRTSLILNERLKGTDNYEKVLGIKDPDKYLNNASKKLDSKISGSGKDDFAIDWRKVESEVLRLVTGDAGKGGKPGAVGQRPLDQTQRPTDIKTIPELPVVQLEADVPRAGDGTPTFNRQDLENGFARHKTAYNSALTQLGSFIDTHRSYVKQGNESPQDLAQRIIRDRANITGETIRPEAVSHELERLVQTNPQLLEPNDKPVTIKAYDRQDFKALAEKVESRFLPKSGQFFIANGATEQQLGMALEFQNHLKDKTPREQWNTKIPKTGEILAELGMPKASIDRALQMHNQLRAEFEKIRTEKSPTQGRDTTRVQATTPVDVRKDIPRTSDQTPTFTEADLRQSFKDRLQVYEAGMVKIIQHMSQNETRDKKAGESLQNFAAKNISDRAVFTGEAVDERSVAQEIARLSQQNKDLAGSDNRALKVQVYTPRDFAGLADKLENQLLPKSGQFLKMEIANNLKAQGVANPMQAAEIKLQEALAAQAKMPESGRPRIGELLVQRGLLNEAQLKSSLAKHEAVKAMFKELRQQFESLIKTEVPAKRK